MIFDWIVFITGRWHRWERTVTRGYRVLGHYGLWARNAFFTFCISCYRNCFFLHFWQDQTSEVFFHPSQFLDLKSGILGKFLLSSDERWSRSDSSQINRERVIVSGARSELDHFCLKLHKNDDGAGASLCVGLSPHILLSMQAYIKLTLRGILGVTPKSNFWIISLTSIRTNELSLNQRTHDRDC